MSTPTPTLRRITRFPVKSLDAESVDRVELVASGGLAGDREFALFDAEGNYVNGKRNRLVHRLRSTVERSGDGAGDEGGLAVSFRTPDAERTVSLDSAADSASNVDDAEAFLRDYFGEPVTLARDREGGFPDDTAASGPTVVSTATLRELASWFDGVDEAGMRRRLRANLELDGVPAFWEDRLFASRGERVTFEIGDVRFEGVNPCQRCVVPSRDPETGGAYPDFRETFVEKRRETMPDWSGGDWFDHHYRAMVNTVVPETEWGKTLRVGDDVRILETRSVE